ncbi:MAG: hypothetical protein FJ149_08575 [Euryarchaeota archaeon]|nr:hypothetical protein [Euryarchaeota archaeon]
MPKRSRPVATTLIGVSMLAPAILLVALTLVPGDAQAASAEASPTTWIKYSGNPVLRTGPAGAFDSKQVFSTSVVRSDGRYYLYYTGIFGTVQRIGLATSSDGKTFTRSAANPVVSSGANASVMKDGADWKMWYCGEGGVRYATSRDGTVWTEHVSNPVLPAGQTGSWDISLKSVCVLRDGLVFKMWYSGGNGDDVRIGLAVSPDGLRWDRYDGNPVLVQEVPWESARVHSPCIIRVSAEYRMWYSASNGQVERICYASSTDGESWAKYPFNPLMPASTQWESPNNLCPVVLYDGRDMRMWYTGANGTWLAQIGYAESPGQGPFAPVLLSPADRGWSNLSLPEFVWSFETDSVPSTQSAYQLQLDDSPDMSSPLLDTTESSRDRNLTAGEPLPDGTYYWRVRAWNGAGDASPWSSISTFGIDSNPPSIESLTINEGAAFTSYRKVRLRVNASDAEDGSGLAGLRYLVEGGPWTAWEAFRGNLTVDLVGQDRLWNISVEVRDRVNNTGPAAMASILLDTTPPTVTALRIENGSAYTNRNQVVLDISQTDPAPGSGPGEMSFSIDAAVWTNWEPFHARREYNLSIGDGPKTVHVRLRDRAGNTGNPVESSIVLDTTAPATSLLRIPAFSETPEFAVSWTSSDALSGIRSFDVEYTEDGGPWTGWLAGTNLTTAAFAGRDGSSYSFRARASDAAGNVEAFPAAVSMSVRVSIPTPLVSIIEPTPQKVVKGSISVAGTASHPKAGQSITLVEVSVDGGPWSAANGTLSWGTVIDTRGLKNGLHNLSARSYDGVKYSKTAFVEFQVENRAAAQDTDITPMIAIVAVVVVVAAAGGWLLMKRRGRRPNGGRPGSPAYDGPPDGSLDPSIPEMLPSPDTRLSEARLPSDLGKPPEAPSPGTGPPETHPATERGPPAGPRSRE